MATFSTKSLSDIGKSLSQTRLNKDLLVKLLRQAEGVLSKFSQSQSLQPEIEPISEALVRPTLLHHKDKDVRLLVSICFSEIIRVLAPNPPYSDEILRDIFKLFISMFAELSDTASPYFTRRVKILETVAALKCCVLMLDVCEDQVLEMFNIFFSVVREDHQQSLFQAMLSIMMLILEEKVSQPLLDVILRNLLKKEKSVTPASFRLAVSVVQNSVEKLELPVQRFLVSSMLDKDAVESELKEFYHDIIFEIFQCAPQMLLSVIPSLTQELLTDQVDVRIKAVTLLGRLFALPGQHIANEYHQLFVEFLKRFSDKSAEVRVSAVECAKSCYMANPGGTEAIEVLSALEGRLLDFDDKVRIQALNAVCDIAKSYLRCIRPDLILHAMERLRDKKVSVRKNAMQKLLELYRSYCAKCSEGVLAHIDHYEQIPSRILALCYDKDCKEFRLQNMELVLAEDLFPVTLSVEERTRHWITSFSFFTSAHIKALRSILSQKRRLQMEMQVYLSLRRKEKESGSEEVKNRILNSFRTMSASFVDPSKAEECFHKLHQMKDNSIFKSLLQLLDEGTTTVTAKTIQDSFRKRIGDKHPDYEFLRLLTAKCSYTIFNAEHVRCLLLHFLSEQNIRKKNFHTAGIDLLLNIVSMFPSLLRGSEEHLLKLFSEEGDLLNDKLLQILASGGPYISLKLSDISPSLEWVCMEGTRLQSKYSVSAIAALAGTSKQSAFLNLYNRLVDSLPVGRNIPTTLQSLGYIAQYSASTYESREEEITKFIIEDIFQTGMVESPYEEPSLNDECLYSDSCKLKIYGLKTLVKSFLPHQGTHIRHKIEGLLNILSQLIRGGDISDDINSSESDRAHVRVAAAKSILQLARNWDLHISPQIFHLVMQKARDCSSHVCRSFLEKIHKLLKVRAIPNRYACAFALAASDCNGDVRDESMKYLGEFIKDYGQEARTRQYCALQVAGGTMTNCPEYIVVFLIHVLAHDPDFPSEDCQDEDAYAKICSPLFVILEAIFKSSTFDGNKNDTSETASFLLSIFQAIKKAEDAVDVCMTSKLHVLSDISASFVKALSHGCISSSHSPGLVLLPSSFYRASCDTNSDKACLSTLTRCSINRSFIERVCRTFDSQIVQPTSHATQGRKRKEISVHSNTECDKRSISLQKKAGPSLTKTARDNSSAPSKDHRRSVEHQLSAKEKNMADVSYTACKSGEIPKQGSTVSVDTNGSPANAEPSLGKERLSSSCGSVVTKPSSSSLQVVSEEQFLECISLDTEGGRGANGTTFPSDISTGNHEIRLTSKDAKKLGVGHEALLGNRIELWSPVHKCFCSATVGEFDSQNNMHKLIYDNGEVERLCLANGSWEVIGNTSSAEKVAAKFHFKDVGPELDSSRNGLKEVIRTLKDKGTQQRTALLEIKENNKDTFSLTAGAVEGRRLGPKLPIPEKKSRSASEVTDETVAPVVRRTRRRKV